jgi:uncharacterized protein YciI
MAELKTSYVVEAAYAEDAATRREPFRAEHLDRVGKLSKEGALLLAGAFADMSASLLVFAVTSEDAVRAIVETDIYWRNGIWTAYTVRRLNRVAFQP